MCADRKSVASQAGSATPKWRQQLAEVARPADRHADVADRVLDDQVPADDPRHQLAERRVGVGVRRARDRHHRRELGVAERREPAGERGEQERDDDRRARRPGRSGSPTIAVPVVAKIPAPMVAPTPSAVRCHLPSERLSPPRSRMSSLAVLHGLPEEKPAHSDPRRDGDAGPGRGDAATSAIHRTAYELRLPGSVNVTVSSPPPSCRRARGPA